MRNRIFTWSGEDFVKSWLSWTKSILASYIPISIRETIKLFMWRGRLPEYSPCEKKNINRWGQLSNFLTLFWMCMILRLQLNHRRLFRYDNGDEHQLSSKDQVILQDNALFSFLINPKIMLSNLSVFSRNYIPLYWTGCMYL